MLRYNVRGRSSSTRNMNVIICALEAVWESEMILSYKTLVIAAKSTKKIYFMTLQTASFLCLVMSLTTSAFECVCMSSHQVILPTHLVVFVKQMNDISYDVCRKISHLLSADLFVEHPSIHPVQASSPSSPLLTFPCVKL